MRKGASQKFSIHLISPDAASEVCRKITADLPEWFGLSEVNEHYATGILSRTSFAASENAKLIGLLSLEFPYPNNANIYWMGIMRSFHNFGIGLELINAAEKYAASKGAKSLTVETLSPKEGDKNYLKTYSFYLKCGFAPLFELKPYGPDHFMLYMYKPIDN